MAWLNEGVSESYRAAYASPSSTVYLFADFKVCPTDAYKEGSVQRVRVASMHHPHYVAVR